MTSTIETSSPGKSLLAHYRKVLAAQFGYPEMRGGQEEVLSALTGEDVLAVMPTGIGKSMCYVLPSIVSGRTLVVSPLIALMQDQVESLRANGVPAGFINSSLNRAQKNSAYLDFKNGMLSILFVAPEALARERFVELLAKAGINLLAIDEAHCVSEWGHDFRPDYLQLGSVRDRLGQPRTLALTATADPHVREDIVRRLGIEHARQVVTSVNRPNLKFSVVLLPRLRDKEEWLLQYLSERRGQSGIIYAASRRRVEELADMLSGQGIEVAGYHAGMSPDVRSATQRNFITGRVPLIVATNAFGMGVNKPDVRLVVHFDMPGRLESYYQEAGRAGRDGEPAECTLLYHRAARRLPQMFIDLSHPTESEVRSLWARMIGAEAGDDGPKDDAGYAMAVRALQESGLVDDRGRPVSPDIDAQINISAITRHRDYAEQKLEQMVAYAEGETCRKSAVLRYFGETPEADCGDCDRCAAVANGRAFATPPELRQSLFDFRDSLAEQRDADPQRILPDRSIDELALYRPRSMEGLLQTWGIRQTRADWLGPDLLRIISDWARRNPTAPKPPVRSVPDRKQRSREEVSAAEMADDPLFARLKEWRRERADRDGVPAYVVFWDRALAEIAKARPTSKAELSKLFGIGAAKLDKYGDDLLDVINGGAAAY